MTVLADLVEGQSARTALGSAATYTIPTTAASGRALATDDYVFRIQTASGNTARNPVADAAWRTVVPYGAVSGGTASFGLLCAVRGSGETYTGTLSTTVGTDATSATLLWGDGAVADVSQWIVGTAKARITAPAETLTCTAPSITTTEPNTRVYAFAFERTTADETTANVAVSGTGWTKLTFLESATASDTTVTVAYKDMVTAGATGACTFTYANTHANNGLGVQVGLPPVPDSAPSVSATFTGSGTLSAAVSSSPQPIAATFSGAGTLSCSVVPLGTPIERWVSQQPYYVAHRGRSAPGLQPEMTMAAYDAAVAWGAKALEISVWRSSDGEWVCNHDADTGRVFSGTNLTISSSTWATLSTKTTITGARPICRLQDVLDAYADSHILIVENKPTASYSAFLDLLDSYDPTDGRIIVKQYYDNDAAYIAASTRGRKTWGYAYDADVLNTGDLYRWDFITLNYDATQSHWDTALASGKPVAAHVCLTAAHATTGLAKGANGVMAGDFEDIIPEGPVQVGADFTGAGTLSATVVARRAVTAPFTGSGTLTATVREVERVAAGFTGSGTLSATVVPVHAITAPLTGSGTLTASVVEVERVVAALSGSGTLTAVVSAVGGPVVVGATFTGSGTLGATVVPRFAIAAPFTGAGTLGASVRQRFTITAPFGGMGTLTATVTATGGTVAVVATFTGAGTLSAVVLNPGAVVRDITVEGTAKPDPWQGRAASPHWKGSLL